MRYGNLRRLKLCFVGNMLFGGKSEPDRGGVVFSFVFLFIIVSGKKVFLPLLLFLFFFRRFDMP